MNSENPKENIILSKHRTSGTSNILKVVQSICLKTISIGACYLAGLYHVSPLWLFAVLFAFIYRDHHRLQKNFKQQVAMAISLRNDRQIIIDNVHHLPPWVYFPDVEGCEWINKILSNIWSNISKFTANILKHTFEPKINETFSAYKKNANFEFQKVSLGSAVPRICGLRQYNTKSRQFDNIIVDLNLFFCGDTMIYFSLMSVGGGIRNIEINGWIRIIFKIVVDPHLFPRSSSLPFLGGIQIFFLHKPKVDFDFTGALDVFDVPGISGMLRKAVNDQISLQMVQPNKITVKRTDIVNSGYWKCPDPEGLVRIHVIKAKDLKDSGSGLFGSSATNPYVVVTFGSQKVSSNYSENSLNPVWNFWANFIIDSYFDEYFLITVNGGDYNQSLGQVSIELNMVKEKRFMRPWIQLEDTNTGMILLEIHYFNLICNRNDLPKKELLYLLVVFINTASILVSPCNQTPNSVVCLAIGATVQVTKAVSSNKPAFEESFTFIINEDPKTIMLKLTLTDKNNKTDLGSAALPLQQVFQAKNMELIDRNCPLLNTAAESSISLSLKLRMLSQDV